MSRSTISDVSVDNFVGMPVGAGDQPYQIWMTYMPGGEIVADSMGANLEANRLVPYSGDSISMYTHCETHIDTFNHFGYNGKELQRVQRRRASRQPRLIQMRGGEAPADLRARVLLDIAEMQGAKVLPPSYAIG
jgi:kynurenine formamidase